MIIDWYTVIMQIINFLILVFLLRHFLYGPIIETMDERERRIVQREEEAAARKMQAEEDSRALRRERERLQQEEENILQEARSSVDETRRELMKEARREVDETRRRWVQAYERERETFIRELRRRVAEQACAIARRCLTDLADARLEELTLDLFIERVASLPEDERVELQGALAAGDGEITLRSAFDAPGEKMEELQASLERILSDGGDVQLQLAVSTDPSLVCGLELESGSYRVSWSVDAYLEGVEEQVLRELDHAPASAEEVGEVSDR